MPANLRGASLRGLCPQWPKLTKRPGGTWPRLEVLSSRTGRFASITESSPAPVPRADRESFAGDHGHRRRRPSRLSADVDSAMMANFACGGLAISVLAARSWGPSLEVVDAVTLAEVIRRTGGIVNPTQARAAAPAVSRVFSARKPRSGCPGTQPAPASVTARGRSAPPLAAPDLLNSRRNGHRPTRPSAAANRAAAAREGRLDTIT